MYKSAIKQISFFANSFVGGDARYRRVLYSSIVSLTAAGIQFLFQLVTTPLLLAHLGNERFGIWMTLYSFIAMLNFLDFGVGLGLLNALSYCNGKGDRLEAKLYISSAVTTLWLIALVISLLAVIFYPIVSWGDILLLHSSPATSDATRAGQVLVASIILSIPASIGARVLAGYQRSYLAGLWDIAAKIMTFSGILWVSSSVGDVSAVAMVVLGSPVVTALGCSAMVFFLWGRDLRPSLSCVRFEKISYIVSSGFLFLVLQIAAAIVFFSDNLIIARILSASAVSSYSVARMLFQFLVMPISLIVTPLWPAYAEAISRKDYAWIKRTLLYSTIIAVGLAAIGGLVLLVGGPYLLDHWTSHRVHVSPTLLAGFCVWTVLTVFGSTVSMVLNAAAVFRVQVVFAVIMTTCTTAAKVILTKHYGPEGLIWGGSVAFFFTSTLPAIIYLRYYFWSHVAKRCR